MDRRKVALFARAWIEIDIKLWDKRIKNVALFARAWIEIKYQQVQFLSTLCRPLCEGVD